MQFIFIKYFVIFEKGYLSPNQRQILLPCNKSQYFWVHMQWLISALQHQKSIPLVLLAFYWLTCFSNRFILLFHSHSWTKLLANTSSYIEKVASEELFFVAASHGMATCSYSELASMRLLSTHRPGVTCINSLL